MKWYPRVALLSVALLCVGLSGVSHAFCRQTTCSDKPEEPCETGADGCVSEGLPLYYGSSCLSFAVAEGSASELGFTDDEFLALVEQAFERWAQVSCPGGGSPGFKVQKGLAVQSKGKFFCEPLPELNLSVWSFETPWPYPKEQNSLGFTTSIFDVDTGEVFDADVEINLPKVAGSNVPPEGRERQVLAILTHEAGHFLGLSHSDEPGAVMAARYTDSDLLNKELTQDDIDGICSIFPPAENPLSCGETGVSEAALDDEACGKASLPEAEGGCGVAGVASHPRRESQTWGLGLVLAMVIGRRRARRSLPLSGR